MYYSMFFVELLILSSLYILGLVTLALIRRVIRFNKAASNKGPG